jgi:hypothetical protein
MQLFVGDRHTLVAAAVQRDIDGISKGRITVPGAG